MIDIFAIYTQYVHPSHPRNASRTTTDSGRVGKVTSTWILWNTLFSGACLLISYFLKCGH